MPDFVIGEWIYVECMKAAREIKHVDLVLALANAPQIGRGPQSTESPGGEPIKDDRAEVMRKLKEEEDAKAKAAEFPTAPLKKDVSKE